jgi:hypothetical protein
MATCQVRIGFTAGGVYSNLSLRTEERNEIALSQYDQYGERSGKIRGTIGYSTGWIVDVRLAEGFSIRTNILYLQIGWKDDVHYSESGPSAPLRSYDYQETYRLTYINCPLYLLFSPPVGTRRLLIGIGPSVSFAIGGKYIFKVSHTTDPAIKDSVDMIGIHDYQRPRAALNANNVDFGLSVIAGMEFRNGAFFHLGFNPGLRNVMTDRYYPFANRYINITASIGMFIGKL